MEDIITKKCPKCNETKNLGEFYESKGIISSWCKVCVRFRSHINYINNPEKYKKQSRDWYREHPDVRTRVNQNYYKNNKDRMRKLVVAWEKVHPERLKAKKHNYRARKLAVGGTISGDDWNLLKIKYGNVCLGCGRKNVKLELDHVIPISRGGKNVISNAQPLCRSCNAKKHAKIIDYRSKIR